MEYIIALIYILTLITFIWLYLIERHHKDILARDYAITIKDISHACYGRRWNKVLEDKANDIDLIAKIQKLRKDAIAYHTIKIKEENNKQH